VSELNFEDLAVRLKKFADARDWEKFHTPKNLAMALSVEVSELAEIFQWMTAEESANVMKDQNLPILHFIWFVCRRFSKLIC
jgi:NTP pyrophosphatase (non-canonical NTP hydrolase)